MKTKFIDSRIKPNIPNAIMLIRLIEADLYRMSIKELKREHRHTSKIISDAIKRRNRKAQPPRKLKHHSPKAKFNRVK